MTFSCNVLTEGFNVSVEFCGVVHARNIRRTSVRPACQVDAIIPWPGANKLKKIKKINYSDLISAAAAVVEEDVPGFKVKKTKK